MKGLALQRAKRLLGEGLLTSEGEFHRRQRRLAQPAFHRARIAAYGELMIEHAIRAQSRWRDGATVDMCADMMRLTLGIVGKTLFAADVEQNAAEVGEAMTVVMELFNTITIPFFELLEKLPLPQLRRFDTARAKLDKIIYNLIDERRRSGDDRGRARLIDSDGAGTVGNGALHVPFVIEGDIETIGGEVGAAGLGAGSLLTKLHVFEDLHCRHLATVAESDVHPAGAIRNHL